MRVAERRYLKVGGRGKAANPAAFFLWPDSKVAHPARGHKGRLIETRD